MLQIKTTAGEAMYETRGDIEAPTLILFHTLLADCSVYDIIIDRLAEHFCVTRFHFPGYGGSTGECNSIDDYADWTAAFFQALKLSEEKKPISIFANGFGGFVSLGLCLRHPALVSHLIIANSGGAFPEERKVPLHGMAQKVRNDGISAVLDIAMSRMFPDLFRKENPEIITCDISGYGEGELEMQYKSYDLLVQAESGLIAISGAPNASGRVGISVSEIWGCRGDWGKLPLMV